MDTSLIIIATITLIVAAIISVNGIFDNEDE